MDNEPCSICLDHLFAAESSEVTRLQPCGHFYHPECIHLWRERSNQCPTCRRDYVLMETLTQQGHVTASEVADRVTLPPMEEEFFEAPTGEDDLIIAPTLYARLSLRIDRQVARSNTCALCDSNRGQVLPCNSCSSTFHGECLGLGQERVAQWFCPMCSAEQGTYQPPSLFRRSRNSERTNRVYNTLMASTRTRNLLSPDQVMTECIVETPQMSPEEVIAWDSFELARRPYEEQLPSSSSSIQHPLPTHTPSQQQRKLKRPSRRKGRPVMESENNSSSDLNAPRPPVTSGPSLIDTLLGQMKEHRPSERIRTHHHHHSHNQQQLHHHHHQHHQHQMHYVKPHEPSTIQSHSQSHSSASMSSTSSSPMALSRPTSPSSPSSPSDTTGKPDWKMTIENNTLSFTQKNILQEIVRKQLRPMYNDGSLSEDQYTQVNMKVSRILYDVCLRDSEANHDLEGLAHWYVRQEVEQLKAVS